MQCDHLRLQKWRAAARAGQAKNSLWMAAAEGGAVWAGRLKCQTRVLSLREGCACPGGDPPEPPDELCAQEGDRPHLPCNR